MQNMANSLLVDDIFLISFHFTPQEKYRTERNYTKIKEGAREMARTKKLMLKKAKNGDEKAIEWLKEKYNCKILSTEEIEREYGEFKGSNC